MSGLNIPLIIQSNIDDAMKNAGNAIDKAFETLENASKAASKIASQQITKLQQTTQQATDKIKQSFNSATNSVKQSVSTMATSATKAFNDISDAAKQASANAGGGISGMFEGLKAGFNAMPVQAKIAVGAIGAVGTAVIALGSDYVQVAKELKQFSSETDMSAESLQKWRYLFGGDEGAVKGALDTVIGGIKDASDASSEMGQIYQQLGVSIYTANGTFKSQESVLMDLVTALSTVENTTERARLATLAIGGDYRKIAQYIDEGKEAWLGYVEVGQKSIVMTNEQVEAGVKLGKQWDFVLGSIKSLIYSGMEPLVSSLADVLKYMGLIEKQKFSGLIDNVTKLSDVNFKNMFNVEMVNQWQTAVDKTLKLIEGHNLGDALAVEDAIWLSIQLGIDKTYSSQVEWENTIKAIRKEASDKNIKLKKDETFLVESFYNLLDKKTGENEVKQLKSLRKVADARKKELSTTTPTKTAKGGVDKSTTLLTTSIDKLTIAMNKYNDSISHNEQILPVWLDRVLSMNSALDIVDQTMVKFGEDYIATNSKLTNNNAFFEFIGTNVSDFEKYTKFLKSSNKEITDELKSIVKAHNVFGQYTKGDVWAKVESSATPKAQVRYNLSSISDNPMLKLIKDNMAKANEANDKLVKLHGDNLKLQSDTTKSAVDKATGKTDYLKAVKTQEDIIGNYTRQYNLLIEMYDQKKALVKLFADNPSLLSAEGMEWLTNSQVVDSTISKLEEYGFLLKGTSDEIKTLIREAAYDYQAIEKAYNGYEDAMGLIKGMKQSNKLNSMPDKTIDDREAKAVANAQAEYDATIEGYKKLEIANSTYLALVEQAQIAHQKTISEITQSAQDERITKIKESAKEIWDSFSTAMNSFESLDTMYHEQKMQRIQAEFDLRMENAQSILEQTVMSDRARLKAEKRLANEEKKNQEEMESRARAFKEKQKAWAITQATINGGLAITDIWAEHAGNPIYAGILTALALAATGAQVAMIAEQKFANGGIIGGNKGAMYGKDDTTISARNGEMVINAPQQKRLWDTISGKSRTNGNGNMTYSPTVTFTVTGDASPSTIKALKKNQNEFIRDLEYGIKELKRYGRI